MKIFLFLLLPLFLLPVIVLAQIPPTPVIQARDATTIEKEIQVAKYDVAQSIDKRNDINRVFFQELWINVKTVMLDQAEMARKAGDMGKVNEIVKAIADWNATRESVWDQDLVILQKKNFLKKLQIEQLKKANQALIDKLGEDANPKSRQTLEESLKVFQQITFMEDQDYNLQKQLLLAEQNYNFSTANELRAQLIEHQGKFEELIKNIKEKVKQIEDADDQQSL